MSASRLLASLTFMTILLGCKPEDEQEQPAAPVVADDAAETFARQICNSLFTCTCTNAPNYASIEVCVDQLSADFQAQIDELLANGASWNAECAGQLVAAWSSWECLGPNHAFAQAPFDPRVCPIIKGDVAPGGDCDPSQLGDDCRDGSVCVSGVCVTTTVPVPLGVTCEYDWQQLPCEAGSYCGYDPALSERVCKPLPVLGDSCTLDDGYLCGPGSLGLVCNYETLRCEAMPAIGEPCFEGFQCGPGTYCDGGKDFTCQERFELGDGCGADAVCPVDASCENSVCQADPAAICSMVDIEL
jgi:hypothetical protein